MAREQSRSLREMLGEFWREVGILVFTFGVLDGLLHQATHGAESKDLPWWWFYAIFGAGAGAWIFGVCAEKITVKWRR